MLEVETLILHGRYHQRLGKIRSCFDEYSGLYFGSSPGYNCN